MFNYIIRRLLLSVVTLFIVTFILYGLIRMMPGSPLTVQQATLDPSRRVNPADLERMRKAYGLDRPWYQAYFVWAGNLSKLDLGRSFHFKQPVTRIIGERLGATLLLSVISLSLTYLLSIPMGLYSTVRSGEPDERLTSTLLFMMYSFPTFVAALLLQLFFAVKLGWLPLLHMHREGYTQLSVAEQMWDVLQHALMPVACYTYGSLAYYSRFIRSNMSEVIRQDYIRTARAKGVPPRRVLWHHAFRNTLIPLVTLIGIALPSLLSGSVIVERIFSWPGIGQLFFESITNRDYDMIMGLTLMFSVLTLAGTLMADLLYAVLDPRISYS